MRLGHLCTVDGVSLVVASYPLNGYLCAFIAFYRQLALRQIPQPCPADLQTSDSVGPGNLEASRGSLSIQRDKLCRLGLLRSWYLSCSVTVAAQSRTEGDARSVLLQESPILLNDDPPSSYPCKRLTILTPKTIKDRILLPARTKRPLQPHRRKPHHGPQHDGYPTQRNLFPPRLSALFLLDAKPRQQRRRRPKRRRIAPDDPPISRSPRIALSGR